MFPELLDVRGVEGGCKSYVPIVTRARTVEGKNQALLDSIYRVILNYFLKKREAK